MHVAERIVSFMRDFKGVRLPLASRVVLPCRLTDCLILALFFVTLVWFFLIPFIGMGWSEDECYMALSCRNYSEQPIAMLSFYAGWLGLKVFGDQVITLRLMATVSYFIAVLIPCVYFYRNTGNMRWTLFLAVACMFFVRAREMNHYGWDSAPAVLESALLAMCVGYVGNPSVKKACWVGGILGALVLARFPAGIMALPVCLAAMAWGVKRAGRSRRIFLLSSILGAVVMCVVMLMLIVAMQGSVEGYLNCWKPENIITGHGLKDLQRGFGDQAVYDCGFIVERYRDHIPLFISILLLLLLDRKSRLVPGVLMIVYFVYTKIVNRDLIVIPHYFVPLALLLFPVCHNLVAKYIRRSGSFVRMDKVVVALVIAFAFVPAIGSDRFMVRLVFFYSLPIMMVGLYPWRNGILKWIMAMMILPALFFSMYQRTNEFRCMRTEDDRLPYHKWLREFYDYDNFIEPVGAVADRLRSEGKRYSAFGSTRYAPMYLFGEEKPFKLNAFHYYYKDETLELLDAYTDSLDAIFVRPYDVDSMTFTEIDTRLSNRGFERTDTAGGYFVYEKVCRK